MLGTGIGVDEEVVKQHEDLRGRYGYLQIKLVLGEGKAKVDKVVKKDKRTGDEEVKDYEAFLDQLPDDDCRYAVYNYHFLREGGDRIRRGFITWCPKNAGLKTKMIYYSSRDAVRQKLIGISKDVETDTKGDLSYEKFAN